MALNHQSQSCENEMPQTNTKERLPNLDSQVRIKVQPTSADKISLTTNEMETLRPTEVLIAEMSSAFERFVSHFRELETNLSHDHSGSSRENLTDEENKDDQGDLQLPHRKQLLAALSRSGLTWEDYKNTMVYLESEKAKIHPNNMANATDLIHVVDEADEGVSELLSDLRLADGTINERLSVPNATTGGKFNPIVSPQMNDINNYLDSSNLNSLKRDQVLAREPTLQMTSVKNTTNKTNEELKERLERKLEEARIKATTDCLSKLIMFDFQRWSYYKDLMDSTAQWQSSSREPSSTTITSKWLDPLPDPETPISLLIHVSFYYLFQENIVLPKSLGDSLEKQLEEERELIKVRPYFIQFILKRTINTMILSFSSV
ncbi:hypothetical protein FBUS_02128 [Fasciolopsis buskii]|uniref:Uncharacterized protein n=1 Tax=Fasciolopsis buskii TaxID=27845 RepID=A0A8E0RTJ9_9TREM|nr:hypothetical protein FBUS_02128 [Fasciolopsis buski]